MRIRGRKPTYNERKILMANGYDPHQWLVTKDTPEMIELMNRENGEIVQIDK